MAAVKASETRTCHTCGVVGHIACNCPTTNPNAAAVQQRLSRWDPCSGGNKAGSFAPVTYGHCGGYRGGPAGGINSGPVGGMKGGPAGGMNCCPAGAGRNGYRTSNFGCCIQSLPLQQVVQQAAMLADYSLYANNGAPANPQFRDAENAMQHPDPLKSAFHAHIPRQPTDLPVVDRDAQFSQQVFGCNFSLVNNDD
eukprot:2602986-Rhodomonas_salina.1